MAVSIGVQKKADVVRKPEVSQLLQAKCITGGRTDRPFGLPTSGSDGRAETLLFLTAFPSCPLLMESP